MSTRKIRGLFSHTFAWLGMFAYAGAPYLLTQASFFYDTPTKFLYAPITSRYWKNYCLSYKFTLVSKYLKAISIHKNSHPRSTQNKAFFYALQFSFHGFNSWYGNAIISYQSYFMMRSHILIIHLSDLTKSY